MGKFHSCVEEETIPDTRRWVDQVEAPQQSGPMAHLFHRIIPRPLAAESVLVAHLNK